MRVDYDNKKLEIINSIPIGHRVELTDNGFISQGPPGDVAFFARSSGDGNETMLSCFYLKRNSFFVTEEKISQESKLHSYLTK